jgi:hypothetical protein
MNLPNLPFDNLYKFSALFGLVLIGYSVFFINASTEDLYKEAYELDERRGIYNSDIKLDIDTPRTKKLLKDSVSIAYNIKYFEHRLDKLPNKMYLFLILFFLGGIFSGTGFYNWYHRLQKHQDKIIKNEALKYSNEHRSYVHKTKFDKEHTIYEDLWSSLIQLRNETLKLRTDTDEYKDEPLTNDVINRRSKPFFDSHKNCYKLFEHKKPFYVESIYDRVSAVLKLCQSEYADFAMGGFSNRKEYWQQARDNSELIVVAIDKVGESIRLRLENSEIREKSS